jgi:hypothetical protein
MHINAEGSESFERALDMSLESSRREFDNRSDDLDEGELTIHALPLFVNIHVNVCNAW